MQKERLKIKKIRALAGKNPIIQKEVAEIAEQVEKQIS